MRLLTKSGGTPARMTAHFENILTTTKGRKHYVRIRKKSNDKVLSGCIPGNRKQEIFSQGAEVGGFGYAMKHYYFESMTPWKSSDGKEEKFIVWFRLGGKIRGKLSFRFFGDEKTAKTFALSLH